MYSVKMFLVGMIAAIVSIGAWANPTAFTKFDYTSRSGGGSLSEVAVGASVKTVYGSFDGAVTSDINRLGAKNSGQGIEVGYSNAVQLGAGTLSARAAMGRKTSSFANNLQYFSLGAEVGVPVTDKVTAFLGYRHRNDVDSLVKLAENRVALGADIALTPQVSLRAGVTHTRVANQKFNGLTTAVSYQF